MVGVGVFENAYVKSISQLAEAGSDLNASSKGLTLRLLQILAGMHHGHGWAVQCSAV